MFSALKDKERWQTSKTPIHGEFARSVMNNTTSVMNNTRSVMNNARSVMKTECKDLVLLWSKIGQGKKFINPLLEKAHKASTISRGMCHTAMAGWGWGLHRRHQIKMAQSDLLWFCFWIVVMLNELWNSIYEVLLHYV
jgi:hypothetical protein